MPERLTQPDWCNAPQPGNWANACMRQPGHEGDHAVRKSHRFDEAWFWPEHGLYPVGYRRADAYPDLWQPCGQPPSDTHVEATVFGSSEQGGSHE